MPHFEILWITVFSCLNSVPHIPRIFSFQMFQKFDWQNSWKLLSQKNPSRTRTHRQAVKSAGSLFNSAIVQWLCLYPVMNSHPPFSEPLLLACKCIPHTKYEKSTIEIPVSLFFHSIGPNLVQLLPQRPHPLYFFLADFQWSMLGDSINFNNLCSISSSEKKLVKSHKNCFLGPICTKKGVIMGHEWKFFFLAEIRKADYQLSETFYFIKIYICFDWVMNFFLSWVMFSFKRVSFSAKTAVSSGYRNTERKLG